jgi:two-component system, response regulator PdtaR
MKFLRVAVADDEPEVLANLEEMLADIGHEVVAVVNNGRALVDACREMSPDLLITDIKMPDMDGLEAAEEIREIRPTPVVIVSAFHDQEFIDRALKEHVLAYLIKPIGEETLKASIELAMQRFREFRALQEQAASLQHALEDRKLIERAKGILMQRAGLSEPAAFKRLQLLSSQKNKKMVEIARTIVEAEQAFDA